jgi:hypothetical protein
MARVHLFTSSTQPYNYKRGPENNISVEEPSLLPSEDIIDNTTISEQPDSHVSATISSPSKATTDAAATVAETTTNHSITARSSPDQQQQQESLANQLTSSSAALTAALLQTAHGNNDMVGAVAAALSVKPGKN